MRQQKKISIQEICHILELPVDSWTFHEKMTVDQAEQSLEEFKTLVKKQRKKLAKHYHPDKTGGDDSKIKQINNVVDLVNKLEITKTQPRPLRPKTHNQWNMFYGSNFRYWTSDSTSATSTNAFNANVRFYRFGG